MARSAGPLVTKGGMSPLSRRVQFSLLTLPLPLPALLLSPFDSLLPHLASLGETLRRRTTEVEGPRQYWDPQPTSEGSWGPFLVTEPQPEAGCPYTECSPLSTAAPSSPHPAHRPSCLFPCVCPALLSLGSEKTRRKVSLHPPWSCGLGVYGVPSSAGEPYPCSVPPPGRGGSEKEGVRDPAFWARKVAKAEVRGVARLSGHRRGTHHADPSRFPQG